MFTRSLISVICALCGILYYDRVGCFKCGRIVENLPLLCRLIASGHGAVVILQVNSGVLGVCAAFFSGEPSTRLSAQDLQELMAALMEFMAVCKKALRIHARLITEEDQEFHSQLVIGFQSLTAELSHFIPAILSGF